jgi:hypothetical protein
VGNFGGKVPVQNGEMENHPPKWGLVTASLLYGQEGMLDTQILALGG